MLQIQPIKFDFPGARDARRRSAPSRPKKWCVSMTRYRVHVVDYDGSFINGVSLNCGDDATAIESAKKYVDGYDIEVWDDDRKVATIPRVE
jgi:hypothetical protein